MGKTNNFTHKVMGSKLIFTTQEVLGLLQVAPQKQQFNTQ